VLDASGAIDHMLIVAREPEEMARQLGEAPNPTVLPQPETLTGLNAALELGREWARAQGFTAMLVLPGDLPLLDAADVHTMALSDASVVIAPDRHGEGTNALFLRLDLEEGEHRFAFAFGTGSFRHHRSEARRLGLDHATMSAPGIALDLDTPEDWLDLPADVREALCAGIREPAEATAS